MHEGYNFSNIEASFKKYISSGNNALGKNTVKNYISDLRHFLGWYHANKKPVDNDVEPALNSSYFAKIDQDAVEDYISYLQNTNNSPKTVKRRISSLSGFLKYAIVGGLIVDNYLKRIKEKHKTTQKTTIVDRISPGKNLIIPEPAPSEAKTPSIVPGLDRDFNIKTRPIIFSLIALTVLIVTLLNVRFFYARIPSPSNNIFESILSKDNGRVLTFRGKLTDSLGNPITGKTDVRFKLYKSPTGNRAVFESNACTIFPDVEGNFDVAIGSSERDINTIGCDKKIPSELFSSVTPLYLGISVGTNAEMKPRQQIANVNLADSALKINGMAMGGNANNIPYIDDSGQISLTSGSPQINATAVSDDFKITSSRSLLLQAGSDGNLTLAATDSGRIRFLTGGSETDKMVIAENGNIGVGTANPTYFKLEVSGSVGPSITKTYNLGAANRLWNTLYVNRICFDEQEKNCTTTLSSDTQSASATSTGSATLSGGSNLGADLLVGGTATDSANVKLSGSSGNHSFIRSGYLGINNPSPTSALDVMGTATFSGNEIDITTHSNQDLTLKANGTGVINLSDTTAVGGNFSGGLDVISGTTTMDIGGTATANALCHSSQSGTDNEQIVDCSSTPIADFAEMYPVAEGADYGQVMSLGEEEVRTTDGKYIRKLVPATKPNDQHLIGVISNNYGDFISVGHNLKKEDNPKPIALKGRVPVNITSASKPIKAGDYLTSSLEPGKALKAIQAGVVIGKALEDWTPTSGKNQIMVFVGTSYADPSASKDILVEKLQIAIGLLQSPILLRTKIISPVVETDSIIARALAIDTIKPKEKDIKIDLSKDASAGGTLAEISMLGKESVEVASIDSAGNATLSGSLVAREASVSGKLTANTIESENIKELERRLSAAVEKSTYNDDINSIQSVLGEIKNAKLPDSKRYQSAPQGLVTNESMSSLLDSLTVMSETNLFRVNVHEKIYSLKDELKISALASIDFLDGAIVMTKEGNITARGTVTAKEVKTKKFSLLNEQDMETASIDATGAARFASLSLPANQNASTPSAIIASERNFTENGILMPAIESQNDSAGVGILPDNEPEVVIYNQGLKNESLIFLTPTQQSSASAALSVAKKVTCDEGQGRSCRPYFSVSAGTNAHQAIYFNWLILNNR